MPNSVHDPTEEPESKGVKRDALLGVIMAFVVFGLPGIWVMLETRPTWDLVSWIVWLVWMLLFSLPGGCAYSYVGTILLLITSVVYVKSAPSGRIWAYLIGAFAVWISSCIYRQKCRELGY